MTVCNKPDCEYYNRDDCRWHSQSVSDPDERLDHLVQQASRPSLATLYNRAKAKGLVRPSSNYH